MYYKYSITYKLPCSYKLELGGLGRTIHSLYLLVGTGSRHIGNVDDLRIETHSSPKTQ